MKKHPSVYDLKYRYPNDISYVGTVGVRLYGSFQKSGNPNQNLADML